MKTFHVEAVNEPRASAQTVAACPTPAHGAVLRSRTAGSGAADAARRGAMRGRTGRADGVGVRSGRAVPSLAAALTVAVALMSFATIAHADGCTKVDVQNLHPGKGPLMLAAYVDAASFNKTAASQLQVAVTGETMRLEVCGLTGPAAALMLYQDLNGNGKLDANPFGIPTEPWGASGKPTPMAAPTWASAQVPLDGNPIVVKLSK